MLILKGEEMPVKDVYGLKARILAAGLKNKELAEILTSRGYNATPTTISRAVNADSSTHSSNTRVAIITYLNEVENGQKT